MSDPIPPSQLYDFNDPRPFYDDDSAFPEGANVLCTDAANTGFEFYYSKGACGRWYPTCPFPSPERVDPWLSGADFKDGSFATFFNEVGNRIKYVKEAQGWRLHLEAQTVEEGGSPPSVTYEILSQTPYTNGQRLHTVLPTINYHGIRLIDILEDKTIVRDVDAPAYGEEVKSPKLSLRFQLRDSGIEYAHQFNVRFKKERNIIKRGDLAQHIAKEMHIHMGHTPLLHQGNLVTFDRLVLVHVAIPCKGSIQPEIGVLCE
ncbi:hypothetical protein BC628DRAFT_68074 [Trametes gibbosa]|nr:hypothetical protein BC628DRAFT_68074 [Trametes gibbosa]